MRIITVEAAQSIDRRSSSEFNYPPAILMENAAMHIWHCLRNDLAAADDRLLIVCGAGNNGGDGLAIARHAHCDGYTVSIIDCAETAEKKSELNRMQTAMCTALKLPLYRWQSDTAATAATKKVLALLSSHNCIIDAITGIGARGGGVHGSLRPLAEAINRQSAPVYAIDVPSGISASFRASDTAIRATVTYTVELPKLPCFTPLARPFCGTVRMVTIGFPPPLIAEQQYEHESGHFLTPDDLPRLYRPLAPFHYKHTRGVVAVYGGCEATIGAALMAADGANASGAGLIHLFPSARFQAALALARPAYITHSRPPDRANASGAGADGDGVSEADGDGASDATDFTANRSAPDADAIDSAVPQRCGALCIGPGWGITPYTRALFNRLLDHPAPRVIDADALTLLSERISFDESAGTLTIDGANPTDSVLAGAVLTPHCAEFARLLGIKTARVLEDPLPLLKLCAEQLQTVIVLKSYVTYIVGSLAAGSLIVDSLAANTNAVAGDAPEIHASADETDRRVRYAVFDGNEITLATGGSGDVLSGVIATLLAQGYDPFHAAQTAVLIHHRAAKEARKTENGYYSADALPRFIARITLQQEY